MTTIASAGGFIRPSIISPTQSTTSSNARLSLPHPRANPLKPGGPKSSALVTYLDNSIQEIQRKHAKRNYIDGVVKDPGGYNSFKEVSKDFERLMNMIWVSGTPSIQVPYLMSLALLLENTLPSYPPAPRSLFRLLNKLDHAFSSLLQGRDIETGEGLPGLEGRKGMSGTDKVRLKSMVDQTRLRVAEVINNEEVVEEEDDLTEDEGIDMEVDGEAGEDDLDSWEMQMTRVYDKTLTELGDSIGSMGDVLISED